MRRGSLPIVAVWAATMLGAIGTLLIVATTLDLALVFAILAADMIAFSTMGLVIERRRQPLRRRVQRAIDRRFNRARVDGERAVEAFARQLRDQVDLDRLRIAVVAAVDDAVAPATASMWLCGSR